ncbi:MmcB family DNA repair protein [Aliisedimentitalea scapharcae]|uniref:MmcB family DNA repair protein n=1 Tax=Aliisedimentitalea scapharcae TaxID=1524259 RepID=UPI0038738266
MTHIATQPVPQGLQPGQKLARGVARHMRALGYATLEEFVPERGLRVDVIALGPKGDIWIVECKSSRVDFQTDSKWQGYLDWCDRFFWAVDLEFPTELLPPETGLIIADAYDAELIRMPGEDKLAPARRKKLVHKFATDAARRLHSLRDPRPGKDGVFLSDTIEVTQTQS